MNPLPVDIWIQAEILPDQTVRFNVWDSTEQHMLGYYQREERQFRAHLLQSTDTQLCDTRMAAAQWIWQHRLDSHV